MRGLWVVLAGALALTGCQFCDRHLIAPGESQVIRTSSGDRYYFDLEENTTTGYQWGFDCSDSDVEVTIDHKGPSEPKPGEPMMCGVPGKASVRIRIHRGFDGPATVRFYYKRSWEPNPIEQFTLSFFKRTGDVAFWK